MTDGMAVLSLAAHATPPAAGGARPFLRSHKLMNRHLLSLAWVTAAASPGALAYDVNDQFAVNIGVTGLYQYGDFDDAFNEAGRRIPDSGRGAVKLDVELDYNPNPDNELYGLARFASGNVLKDVWPGPLAPTAHDLEDGVRNINDHARDNLLQAWYRHTFRLTEGRALSFSAGVLDGTGYLDQNDYADDEDVAFMNDAFVNPDTIGLPVYDWGGVAEYESGPWTLAGLVMNTPTGDDANHDYNFYGAQVAYTRQTPAGEGHYRVWAFTTSSDFLDPAGLSLERRQGLVITLDQPLNDILGVFVRTAWQKQDAAVDHQSQYSGGLHFYGRLWGRPDDDAGIGYAYLDGGNLDIDSSQVLEAYVRFQINQYADLALDLQYLDDQLSGAPNRSAWVPGIRVDLAF